MLNIKFSLLIIILISYVHCRDKCIFCNQSVNACTICYFNCTDLIFNSCNDGQDNLNEITCLQNCCHSDINSNYFNQQVYDKCISRDGRLWAQMSAYYAVLGVGATAIVILVILMLRGIYVRVMARQSNNIDRRILPTSSIPSFNAIITNDDSNFNRSSQELQQEIRNYPRNSNQIMIDQSNTCCICLQNHVNSLTKCGHVFHLNCLIAWGNRKNSCPLCSYKNIYNAKLFCINCKDEIKQLSLVKMKPKQILDLTRPYCNKCKRQLFIFSQQLMRQLSRQIGQKIF